MRKTPISKSSARARVRLSAIEHNLGVLKKSAGSARVMAVVKANAYGHGLVDVASVLRGVEGLGVARIDEARTLRNAGVECPITVLGGFYQTEFDEAAELDLRNVVHTAAQVEALENFGGRFTAAWLKIDTGMHRLGFDAGDARVFIERLQNCGAIGDLGLMTHLSSADDPGNSETTSQVARFASVVDGFPGEISIANSAAMLAWPELHDCFQNYLNTGKVWVRPGLAMYGISPVSGKNAGNFGLKPAMQLEAPLISFKRIRVGDAVGYGQTWTASSDTVIGVIAAGYADGYSRHVQSGCPIILNGRRVAVAGIVSMDLLAVDLGPDADDNVGDTAILWGDDLPAEEIAGFADTIPYTLVTGVSARVARIFE